MERQNHLASSFIHVVNTVAIDLHIFWLVGEILDEIESGIGSLDSGHGKVVIGIGVLKIAKSRGPFVIFQVP